MSVECIKILEDPAISNTIAGTTDPDLALVTQVRRGDRSAFEQLYRRHNGRVFALCRRMSGNEAEAEELAQEVFVRVWQKLGTFREGSRFSSWLYQVTVNQVRDGWRRKKRVPHRITLDDQDGHPTVAMIPQGTGSERVDLERAIDTLPAGARHVLVLHDVHGYKHNEIATMTGSSVGNSKSQLHRARRLLRERLQS